MPHKFGYEVVCRLGGGLFSDVFEVRDSHAVYALKVVEPEDERPPHNVRNEASMMVKLRQSGNCTNVVRLLSEFTNPLEIALLFPIYRATLPQMLEAHCKTRTHFHMDGSITRTKANRMSVPQIRHVAKGIMAGLQYVHQCGIIHRDINPNNILFRSAASLDPVLIDFGISYDLPDNNGLERHDRKYTDIATGFYKAPELLLSARDYGTGVDLWAAGIVISLLCSADARVPFEEDAAHSDLSLLSNIVAVFGSPPPDWQDCQGSRSFAAMNEAFFERAPRPTSEVIPLADEALAAVFRGVTRYPSKERLSARQAVQML